MPYHIWYIGCSSATCTARANASDALSHSVRCVCARPMPYQAAWLSDHFSVAFSYSCTATSNCLAPRALLPLFINVTESFLDWFGHAAQRSTTKTPSSFMGETVFRLRTRLKSLIVEDRRRPCV